MLKKYLYAAAACFIISSCGQQKTQVVSCPDDSTAVPSTLLMNTTAEASTDASKSQREKIRKELPSYTKGDILLYRTAYTACYDKKHKLPRWVAWYLTASHASARGERGSEFTEDEEVPYPRAIPADYRRSGYDRGHMCPAGDNKWSTKAMRETFLLTNICPQDHDLNSGDWGDLEKACRHWAKKYGNLHIVCGPIFNSDKPKTIGKNNVAVPDAFFKVIICLSPKSRHNTALSPKGIGFIYKNIPGHRPMSYYACPIDEVERITGLDFHPTLADDIENSIEAQNNINQWQ